MPPKVISGGDNPYDIHDAKLSSSATAHESSSVTAHEISNSQTDYIKRFTTRVFKGSQDFVFKNIFDFFTEIHPGAFFPGLAPPPRLIEF